MSREDFDFTKLAPCAVCGSPPKLCRKKVSRYYYECDGNCWTRTPTQRNKDDAAKAWNAMQYTRQVQGETEAVPFYDRATALAVLKEFSRDMYVGYDIFGRKELRISTSEFEAIRKKYLE